MTAQNKRERILKKAYEIWESEGRASGRDMDYWLRAERLIAEETGKDKAKTVAKPRKTAAKAKTSVKEKAKSTTKAKTTIRKTSAKPKN